MIKNMQNTVEKTKKKSFKSSGWKDFHNFLIRLGKILFNWSILFLILCIIGALSAVGTAMTFVIGVIPIICTLGLIFIIVPGYWDALMNTTGFFAKVTDWFGHNYPIFVGLALGLSIVSLILLKLDRTDSHLFQTVFSSIVIAIALLIVILIWANAAKVK